MRNRLLMLAALNGLCTPCTGPRSIPAPANDRTQYRYQQRAKPRRLGLPFANEDLRVPKSLERS